MKHLIGCVPANLRRRRMLARYSCGAGSVLRTMLSKHCNQRHRVLQKPHKYLRCSAMLALVCSTCFINDIALNARRAGLCTSI